MIKGGDAGQFRVQRVGKIGADPFQHALDVGRIRRRLGAPGGDARGADLHRAGPQGFRGRALLRPVRARRHAARGDRTAVFVNQNGKRLSRRSIQEIVRKAAKNIEAQISHYGNYKYSDKQDLLAMVALHFATSAVNNENEVSFVTKSLSPTLTDLYKILTNRN